MRVLDELGERIGGNGKGGGKGGRAKGGMYFTEIHRFHSFATKCWTDGGTGTCLSGADDQLDDLVYCDA